MHNDELLQTIGAPPALVERLTTVEFDNERGRWVVRAADTGTSLFSNLRRDVCLDWERDNAVPLLLRHLNLGDNCSVH